MQADIALRGDFAQSGDVVDDAVREVWRAANQHDSVAVDEAADVWYRCLVAGRWTWDVVDLDLEVFSRFAESRMGCLWKNAGRC